MTEKEKFPTSEATLAGNAGGKSGETFSENDSTTSGSNSQDGRIWKLLPEGESLAVPANTLAELAGFKNTRSLRAAIDRERNNHLILASDEGYFRPSSGEEGIAEIKRYIRRMDGRCASNRRNVRLARATLRVLERAQIDGQMEIQIGGSG